MRADHALVLAHALVLLGCAEGDPAPRPAPTPVAVVAKADAAPPIRAELARFDGGADEAAALAAIGALPAWRGVLERWRLLARRGEAGALVGVVASAEGERVLIDDRAGRGALFVRLGLPADAPAIEDGARVVAWGGFVADGERWRFAVTRIERLSTAAGDAVALVPSHQPRAAAPAPEGATPPAELIGRIQQGLRREQREAAMRFTVRGAPVASGDGWAIDGGEAPAKPPKGAPPVPPTAYLMLPGEAPIYGGQDYRASEERWALEIGRAYAVTIAVPSRLRMADGVPVLEAVDAPVAIGASPARP
jgi:hypothetical protein